MSLEKFAMALVGIFVPSSLSTFIQLFIDALKEGQDGVAKEAHQGGGFSLGLDPAFISLQHNVEQILMSSYDVGVSYLEDALITQSATRKNELIESATRNFREAAAKLSHKPLYAAKAEYCTGNSYKLLGENDLAVHHYTRAYNILANFDGIQEDMRSILSTLVQDHPLFQDISMQALRYQIKHSNPFGSIIVRGSDVVIANLPPPIERSLLHNSNSAQAAIEQYRSLIAPVAKKAKGYVSASRSSPFFRSSPWLDTKDPEQLPTRSDYQLLVTLSTLLIASSKEVPVERFILLEESFA